MNSLFADLALARRLEKQSALEIVGYAEVLAALGLRPQARALPIADGHAVHTGLDLPINRASGLGMSGPVTTADLEQIEQFFAEVGLSAQVDLCPLADPSLMALLGERGYWVHRFYNVFARPVTEADAKPSLEGEVKVVKVGPDEAEAWMKVVAQGFAGRDELSEEDMNLVLTRVALNRPGVTCFLATVDGELAGGGALSMHNGLATFFSASTRPAFRQHGVQKVLILARLAAAYSAGCDLATVMTTPGTASQRNMERQGFQVVYSRPTLIRRL